MTEVKALYSDDDPEPTFEDAKKAGARPVYGAYTCVDCGGSGVQRRHGEWFVCEPCDGKGAI